MVGRKKKTKFCEKGLQEDLISQLPDALISEILGHLSTKEAIRTSVLSNRWRDLWQCVPGLDLDSWDFTDVNGFVSFADNFFGSHKESWIRKFRLHHDHRYGRSFLTKWIDAVAVRRIHHLDVGEAFGRPPQNMPLSIYTCETLVHLRICWAVLVKAEFVSLPCLKIMHLECIYYLNEATLEKLISGSPVLEDLTILDSADGRSHVYQVRSQTLKRIHTDQRIQVVIDAPLLQCFKTTVSYKEKKFKIINLGFSTKIDIDGGIYSTTDMGKSLTQDILADISRVKDLVISNVFWKDIFLYSESGPLLEFCHLSRLNAKFSKSDLEMLPTILESCPKLESLIMELVKGPCHKNNREPKVTFSTVPLCLVSSLKFVELKRLISRYEGETELVRYFLKNSAILEKLRLDTYYTKKAMRAFLKEVVAMPRCSSACEVLVL